MDNWDNYARYIFTSIGTLITSILGGWDTVLQVLVAFVVIDYFTGVLAAWYRKELSSEIGAKGIAKKILIFVMIAVASLIDRTGVIEEPIFRTLACWFYIANEGLSILENTAKIGVPIPESLKKALLAINTKASTETKPD